VLKADSAVFAVGGLQEVSTTQQEVPYMEKYDPKIDQWEAFPTPNLPFPVDCSSYKAVGLGNEIILIDSIDFTVHDPRPSVISLRDIDGEPKFERLAPIPHRRAGHCIATASGHVYIIGGSTQAIDRATPFGENTVERYDRQSGNVV
jgi:hypothetical protein